MGSFDFVKCDKPKVRVCGYRLLDGECSVKSVYDLFECFEKEPSGKGKQ